MNKKEIKYSFPEIVFDRSMNDNVPTPKNGAHVGKKYQGLTESGDGINRIQTRKSKEILRIVDLFEVNKGKQIATSR